MGNKLDTYTSFAKAFSATWDIAKQLWPYVGGIVVAAIIAAWAYLTQWGYIPIVLFGLAALVLSILAIKLLRGSRHQGDEDMSDDSKNPIGNVYVTSHNQSGGITAQNVHVNAQMQRKMGEKLKTGLLNSVPRNKRVVVWSIMGNQESHVLAVEVFAFLKSNGFSVFGDSAHQQMFITPLHGVRFRDDGENFNVEIGLPDGTEIRSV